MSRTYADSDAPFAGVACRAAPWRSSAYYISFPADGRGLTKSIWRSPEDGRRAGPTADYVHPRQSVSADGVEKSPRELHMLAADRCLSALAWAGPAPQFYDAASKHPMDRI